MEKKLQELKKLKEKVSKLEKEINSEFKNSEYGLATKLHELLCTANHTDGCSWGYENNNQFSNPNSTKGRYVEKARKLLAMNLTPEKIFEIIKILRSY